MARLRIELFGDLRITSDGEPVLSVNTTRLQSLLGALLLNHGVPQSREHLAFVLWPDSTESQARTNLRQLIHHLRRALPAEICLLSADNHTITWRDDPGCMTDVLEFDTALARAKDAAARHEPQAETQALEDAARLYQDDLLRALFDEWLQPKRDYYRAQLRTVLQRLAACYERGGDYPSAIRHAERLVNLDPMCESHHQLLIRLYAANHDRASALRAYHQCMKTLRRELGVEPGVATRALFEKLLKDNPAETVSAKAVGTSSAGQPPLIGRKSEQELLARLWQRVASGDRHLAVIAGEPGIGKSRVAEVFFDSLARNSNSAARTRCYSGQGQVAYAPIADWLRSEPLRAARGLLGPGPLAELSQLLPEIQDEIPGLPAPRPLTEGWQRMSFYNALQSAFSKAGKPLPLLIDDLQWCDENSFQWLLTFFRAPASAGVLVLATLRTGETGRDHPYVRLAVELRQSGLITEIPLGPLNPRETASLAARVANHDAPALELEELYRATGGNPLFIIESVRAVQDGSSGAIPPRVQAVISARLAQLSKPAYELSGVASAVGRPFSAELLAKATDWDEDSLSRALDELYQRKIVEARGSAGYDFTHDRLREVAYSEMSIVRRRYAHKRLAQSLQDLHAADSEAYAAQVAAHYDAAGLPEEAIRFYTEASSFARQRYADSESADLIRRALALCRDFPETRKRQAQELDLLVRLGLALVSTRGYSVDEVGQSYARALELCRGLGDHQYLLPVLSGAWVFHMVRAQFAQARSLAEELLQFAIQENSAPAGVAANFMMVSSLYHVAEFEAAMDNVKRCLAAYRPSSRAVLAFFAGPDVRVFCRSYSAHLLWQLGDPERARAAMSEAIDAAREVGHPFSMAIALDYAALLQALARDPAAALQYAEDAAALCRKHEFAYYLSMAEIVAGWASAVSDNGADGIRRLRSGIDALRRTGAEIRLPFYYGLLAEACASAGLSGEALANMSTAFAYQAKNGETWAASDLHRIHGDLLKHTNREAAEASYRKALDAARQCGAKSFGRRAEERLEHLAERRRSAV